MTHPVSISDIPVHRPKRFICESFMAFSFLVIESLHGNRNLKQAQRLFVVLIVKIEK
jgi:hypothetical protein